MWRLSGQTRDGCLGHLLRGKLQQLNRRDSAAEVSGHLHLQGPSHTHSSQDLYSGALGESLTGLMGDEKQVQWGFCLSSASPLSSLSTSRNSCQPDSAWNQ